MSEVARIRHQIDQEIEAMNRLLTGPAMVATHAAIHCRMQTLWSCKQQLDVHLPAEETTVILIQALDRLQRPAHVPLSDERSEP